MPDGKGAIAGAGTKRRASPLPPAERRDAIIAAALPVLIERGPATTSRELAAAAGVAEGTIWKAFADKDDLLAAALEHAADATSYQAAVRAIDPALPFEERLTLATELLQRRIVGVWKLFMHVNPSGRPDAPQRLPDDAAMVELLGSAPDRLRLDPTAAARRLRALVLAVSNETLVDPPLGAGEIVDMFLHGVGARR